MGKRERTGSLFLFISPCLLFQRPKTRTMEARIRRVIEEKLKEEEWQDCFLVDLEIHGKKVEVYVDCDEGVTFDRCKRLSRHIEAFLDEEGYLEGKYWLEVSSPGVDRPLKMLRQYARNVGRSLKWSLKDGSEFEGELVRVDGDTFSIKRPDPEKPKQILEETLTFGDIEKAIVQISFKKKKK